MKNFQNCNIIFEKQFGQKARSVFFAPGRINLIGEHTDYNGGRVFPCALTFGTYALARKNDSKRIRLYSMNFPENGIVEFTLADLDYNTIHDWANYPKGMIRYIIETGCQIDAGIDILFYGEIPNGAGLSSSASIEMVMGVLLKGLFDLNLDPIDLVKIGKKVENQFMGVNSGIMDQFVIGLGKANYGILLDCQTLKYSYAPIKLDNYDIIIMNTNKRRELADSKYNERRSECEAALVRLQTQVAIKSLGELDENTFDKYKRVIANEIWIKRAKHAVLENARTIKAAEALARGDLIKFGQLVNESHISLRDDYQVTGKELDTLVEAAWRQPGVIGARMTGAGFGGCAIGFVEKAQRERFILQVGEFYNNTIGYEASFYIANIGDGAKEITKDVM
ncbi:MAG: galK [Firmicutes bacterium]|nr:galK [Bacillota bacterium]